MTIYPPLKIPETLAAGPGPGNTDPRVLERFVKTGVADHMQQDVLRGMIEAKEMLRELWGTKNCLHLWRRRHGLQRGRLRALNDPAERHGLVPPQRHFFGHRWPHQPHEGVHEKASPADSFNPKPKSVITVQTPHGQSVTGEIIDKALAGDKPMWAFMAHWETGSGRINDVKGFSDACVKHGVMGIVDAGVEPRRRRFQYRRLSRRGGLGVVSAEGCAVTAADLRAGELHQQGDRGWSRSVAAAPMCTTRSSTRAIGVAVDGKDVEEANRLSPDAFLLRRGRLPRGAAYHPRLRAAS